MHFHLSVISDSQGCHHIIPLQTNDVIKWCGIVSFYRMVALVSKKLVFANTCKYLVFQKRQRSLSKSAWFSKQL